MHKNTPQTNAGYGLAACAHYNPPQRPFIGFDAIARHFPNMRIRGKTARGPCPIHQSGNPKGQTLAMREKP
ncbi:MAG: hypothetical protein PF480_09005, partial [Roseovarius sp.]|nr:hypothetical protein [Roseovarius sp.]